MGSNANWRRPCKGRRDRLRASSGACRRPCATALHRLPSVPSFAVRSHGCRIRRVHLGCRALPRTFPALMMFPSVRLDEKVACAELTNAVSTEIGSYISSSGAPGAGSAACWAVSCCILSCCSASAFFLFLEFLDFRANSATRSTLIGDYFAGFENIEVSGV